MACRQVCLAFKAIRASPYDARPAAQLAVYTGFAGKLPDWQEREDIFGNKEGSMKEWLTRKVPGCCAWAWHWRHQGRCPLQSYRNDQLP